MASHRLRRWANFNPGRGVGGQRLVLLDILFMYIFNSFRYLYFMIITSFAPVTVTFCYKPTEHCSPDSPSDSLGLRLDSVFKPFLKQSTTRHTVFNKKKLRRKS